jgi:hypothetical protein
LPGQHRHFNHRNSLSYKPEQKQDADDRATKALTQVAAADSFLPGLAVWVHAHHILTVVRIHFHVLHTHHSVAAFEMNAVVTLYLPVALRVRLLLAFWEAAEGAHREEAFLLNLCLLFFRKPLVETTICHWIS